MVVAICIGPVVSYGVHVRLGGYWWWYCGCILGVGGLNLNGLLDLMLEMEPKLGFGLMYGWGRLP